MTNKTPMERFQEKYTVNQETGCWEWTAGIGHNGYARFKYNGKTHRAHRWIWEQIHTTPSELILHRCDNRKCVNPEHLFAGTQHDNIHDMLKKGRHRQLRGEALPQARLTQAAVRMIRELYDSMPTTHAILARNYGVSAGAIGHVLRRDRWKAVA